MDTGGSDAGRKHDKEIIAEECTSVTASLQQIVGTDWSEVDETVKLNCLFVMTKAGEIIKKER